MSIVDTEPSMFCDFRIGGRVAGPQIRTNDDIWNGWIRCRVAKAHADKLRPGDELLNLQSLCFAIEVCNGGFRVGAMVEEYQADVICLFPKSVHDPAATAG